MARNRMIKPEFWSSKSLMKVSRDARLFFIGLWNFADDYGILQNSNRWLVGNIFPYDEEVTEKDIIKWKDELVNIAKVLIVVVHQNQEFLFIPSWNDHQKVAHPGKKSIPDEIIHETLMRLSRGSHAQIEREVEREREIEIEVERERGGSAKKISPSPAQTMQNFILIVSEKNQEYQTLVFELVAKSQFETSKISAELDKFVNYWTEKTKDGSRQRWQLEKTFEVQRRLAKWFENVDKYAPRPKGGLGVFIS